MAALKKIFHVNNPCVIVDCFAFMRSGQLPAFGKQSFTECTVIVTFLYVFNFSKVKYNNGGI